jgi:hypothetical protein
MTIDDLRWPELAYVFSFFDPDMLLKLNFDDIASSDITDELLDGS